MGQRHALFRGAGMRNTVEGGGLLGHAEPVRPHEALGDNGLAIARAANGPADLNDARLLNVARRAEIIVAELSDRTLYICGGPGRPIAGFYVDADNMMIMMIYDVTGGVPC